MSLSSHVGKEDSYLTVVHLSGRAAILHLDPGRVGSPFGKATDHSITYTGKRTSGTSRLCSPICRREGGLRHCKTYARTSSRTPSRIPDGPREQALHAIGTGLFGMFCNLPAIFPVYLAHALLYLQAIV